MTKHIRSGFMQTFPNLPAGFRLSIDRFQIGPEERALAKLFGAEFAAYRLSVRKWLRGWLPPAQKRAPW